MAVTFINCLFIHFIRLDETTEKANNKTHYIIGAFLKAINFNGNIAGQGRST